MSESLLAPIFRIDATAMFRFFRFHPASTDVVLSSFGIAAGYLSQNAVCDLRAARYRSTLANRLSSLLVTDTPFGISIFSKIKSRNGSILREFLDLRRVNELVPSDGLFRTDLTARRPFRCTPFKSSGEPLARLIAIISRQIFLPRL